MFDLRYATNLVSNPDQNVENVYISSVAGPELTYTYVPNGVFNHHLKLKLGLSVLVIQNALHPNMLN